MHPTQNRNKEIGDNWEGMVGQLQKVINANTNDKLAKMTETNKKNMQEIQVKVEDS